MCGRFELHTHPAAIALAFGLAHPPEIAPHYNIAPTQDVPVVRINSSGDREVVRMRWGLVPRWAKDPSIGTRMINARCETIEQKPAYRNAFRRHRCLIPADAFYEWKATAHGKQPMRIALSNSGLFGMAGLYERWLSPQGEVLDTCTILTTQSNALVRPLHDRMPVIVPAEHYARWLDVANSEVDDLFQPYPAEQMRSHAVSKRVNTVQNDDASLIEPVIEVDATAAGTQRGPAPVADNAAPSETEDQAPAVAPVQPELF